MPKTRASFSLGLLVAIQLFDFIDRYVFAAVEPSIRSTFFSPDNPNAMWWSGTLSTAFGVSYMISALVFGWLADHFSRWVIIGAAAIIWSVATAATGIAGSIVTLFIARIFVGIGQSAYNPAAPPVISDLFPAGTRSTMLAIFFAAVPIGSALGYVFGGLINVHLGWRPAFYIVSVPGLLLGMLCFFQKELPGRTLSLKNRTKLPPSNYLQSLAVLLKRPSYSLNVAAQTSMAFALGGLAYWMPAYLQFRQQPASATMMLGAVVAIAGLTSTLAGGFLADRYRTRLAGADLLISGVGMLAGFPLVAGMLYTPFPFAWVCLFGALFFIFFNTGPANAAVLNVSVPAVRAMACALSIFVMHAFGDVIAPPLVGFAAGHTNMNSAFLVISAALFISGLLWLIGARYLPADMAMVETAERPD